MPTNRLTDNQCRSAKPTAKARKMFDGHGLHLFVSPAGAKTWRVAYRLDGKPQTASLGPYPLLSLADARVKRDELRRKVLDGENPKAETRRGIKFSAAVEQYWNGRQDVSAKYRGDSIKALETHVLKDLGEKPLGAITRDMMLETLLKLNSLGKFALVRKVRMRAVPVFDWGLEHRHCTSNPAKDIKPEKAFGKSEHQPLASLELSDVHAFFDRLKLEGDLRSVLAAKMLTLTWVRTREMRFMRWDQIDGDLWRVPRGTMKKRRDHLVPLSRQALDLLDILRPRCQGSVYVFPGEHTNLRPISENTVLYLLYRMGLKGKMTGHGFRSIGSTWANERGFNADAVERQLAHAPADKTRGAYNRAEYLPERRQILQAFADWLDNPNPGLDQR
jgi:integrase